jgi:hypothetical protein
VPQEHAQPGVERREPERIPMSQATIANGFQLFAAATAQ